jgi:hypothetical protein
MKHHLAFPFLALLVLCGAFLVTGCDPSSNAADNPPAAKAQPQAEAKTVANTVANTNPAAAPDKVVAYYFHGDRRCKTCLGIQSAIQQTIKERFADETASGALVFQEVNIDQDANKRFVQEFQLSFSTLIVATKAGDKTVKWENCEKVWEYAHNQPALMEYTEGQIRQYLSMLKGQ